MLTSTMTSRLRRLVVLAHKVDVDAFFRHAASSRTVRMTKGASSSNFTVAPAALFSTMSTGASQGATTDADANAEKNQPPSFDAVKSAIYQKIAANHRHPQGPWPKMVQAVQGLIDHEKGNNNNNSNLAFLDLATGPGEPAASLAAQFPSARVIGTDISQDQVALAQKSPMVLLHKNLEICQADMQNLENFTDEQFDIVTCCYGFMFPPNIPQAIAETHRVLKPGGHLVATTWNKVRMMELTRDVLGQAFGPEKVPVPPMNPLSLQEPGLFENMLEQGGFHAIDSSPVTYPFDFGNDADFYFQAFFMLQTDFIDAQGGKDAWEQVRRVFDRECMKWGRIEKGGNFILEGSEYKLTIAKK